LDLEKAFTELDSIVWEADPATLRFSYVDERAAQVLGYPAERWVREPDFVYRLLPEADRQRVIDLWLQTSRSGAVGRCEHRVLAADGRLLWFRTTVRRRGGALLGSMIDVSELRAAVDRHREREAHHAAALNLALDGVVSIDDRGRIIDFNPAAERMFGYRCAEVLGQDLADLLIPPSLRPLHRAGLRRFLESGEGRVMGRRVEFPALRRDGTEFPVEVAISAIRVGSRTTFTGTLRDLTDRKRAENALREARERLLAVVNHAPIVLFALDRDGIFTLSEGRGLKALGLAPGEVVGRSALELYREVPWIVECIHRALGGEELTVEGDVAGLRFETHYAPLKDAEGAVVGCIGVAIDITARTRAEAERMRLLEREREARCVAEAAQRRWEFLAEATGLLASAVDYRVRLTSLARLSVPYLADWCVVDILERGGSFRRMAVACADPARAALAAALERYPPDSEAPEPATQVVETGKPVIWPEVGQYRLEPRSGASPREVERLRLIRELGARSLMTVPLAARDEILGALTFVLSGEQRRYGPADLALALDLAQRAALLADNARLYEEAQEAVRSRDEFLSIASHELRTPITSLQLAVQNLLRIARRGSLADRGALVINALEVAERQSKHLAKLVDELLDVTRISANRLALDLELVDLAGLARDVLETFAEAIAAARCSAVLDAPSPVVGRWDRARLEQVLTNLLSNAVKYGAGSPVEVAVRGDGEQAWLSVRDHGIGIERERLDQIFGRFERGVSARSYGGLGLGLYIVRQIVTALGGKIRVESELGRGSTFLVELPLTGPAEAQREG
jgi:PAS domain S-box-containing protein